MYDVVRTATSALLLTRLGAEHGVAAQAVLAGTGLGEEDLVQPGAEVTGRQELRVVRNLVAATGDPHDLGLQAGSRYHLTTYGIWGFALISSPTLRNALAVGLRYFDLTFAFTALTSAEEDGELLLRLDSAGVPAEVRRFVVARDTAALRTAQRELLGPAPPLRVELALPAPPDLRPWRRTFGVRPVFDAPLTQVVLPAELLDLPLPQADEHTAAMAEQQCRDLLTRRQARVGLSGRVRDAVLRSPGAVPSVDGAAAALHLSARTLRRRLAEEGTSYRGLVDEVRETLAEELLRTGGLTVEEVARRLGYAETASFTHAFTRWKGVSPRRYAQRTTT